MERIAIFVDDAENARRMLSPLLAGGAGAVSWVVVACAPKLSRHLGQWVSRRSREHWREQWARALRDRLETLFPSGDRCEWMLAKEPLDRVVRTLRQRPGAELRVLDARRAKRDVTQAPLSAVPGARPAWAVPVAVSSVLSLVLALAD